MRSDAIWLSLHFANENWSVKPNWLLYLSLTFIFIRLAVMKLLFHPESNETCIINFPLLRKISNLLLLVADALLAARLQHCTILLMLCCHSLWYCNENNVIQWLMHYREKRWKKKRCWKVSTTQKTSGVGGNPAINAVNNKYRLCFTKRTSPKMELVTPKIGQPTPRYGATNAAPNHQTE